MHILLDNFHQGGKYSDPMAIHKAELIKERIFTDQMFLSISSLQTDYLILDSSSGSGKNNERENPVLEKCNFFGGANHSAEKYFKKIRKEKEKYRAAGDSDKRQT